VTEPTPTPTPDRAARAASTPLAGLLRQATRLAVAAGTAFLVGQGLPEAVAAELGEAPFVALTGTLLPVLAWAGKKLRDIGNPLGELL
jgi:hypothetical protein